MNVPVSEWFNTGGTLASYLGLGTTLIQWMTASSNSRGELNVDEYLEWLRRENHQDLVRRLAENSDALEALALLIFELKSAVIQSITDHDLNSERRHAQVMSLVSRIHQLEAPLLKITTDGVTTHVESSVSSVFQVAFEVVNLSNCNATITKGSVTLDNGQKELVVPIKINWHPPLLHVEPRGGTQIMGATTNSIPRDVCRRAFSLKLLTLKLAQESHPRRYVSPDGVRLQLEEN